MTRANWTALQQRVANAVHSLGIDDDGNPNGSYAAPGGGDAVPVRVILQNELVEVEEFAEVSENQLTLSLLAAEVNAVRGAVVVVGEVTYTLARLVDDDGIRSKWTVIN